MIIRSTQLNKSYLSSTHHEKRSNKEEIDVDDFLNSFEKSFKSTSFDIDDKMIIPPDQKNHYFSQHKSIEKDYDFKNDTEDINKAKFYKDLQSLYPSESSKILGQNSISLELTSKQNFQQKGFRIDQNDTCYDQIEQILNNMSAQDEFIVVQESNAANMDRILESSLLIGKNQIGISPSRKKLSEFLLLDPNLERNFADGNNNISVIEKSERNKNLSSPFFKKKSSFKKEGKGMNNSGITNEIECILNNNSGIRNENNSKIISKSNNNSGKKMDINVVVNKENESRNNTVIKSSSEPKIIHIQGGDALIPAKMVIKENAKSPAQNKNQLVDNEEKLIRTKNCIIY